MDEQMIQALTNLMQTMPCEVTYEVKNEPKGIHIVIDVTQEQMDEIVQHQIKCKKNDKL